MGMQGGCCCGAVRYEIEGQTFHRTLCFCPTCRRVAGAPSVAWFSVRHAQFHLLRGQPAEFASSPHVTRSFCAACGTPLTYANAHSPGELDVTTCSLDDPMLQPPQDRTMWAYHLGWSTHVNALPAYEHGRSA